MKVTRTIVVVLLSLVVAVIAQDAPDCGSLTTCGSCVEKPLCGWCSVPVVYQDGTTGPQCAGFSSGSQPFICNAIYSTEVCVAGYVCNDNTGTCDVGAPGKGNTLAGCQSTCTKERASTS